MLAVDTNIVIRYLTNDDRVLSPKARTIVDEGAVFVPVTVALEAEWVLREVYGFEKSRVLGDLRRFFGLETVTVAQADAVERALAFAESGLDFADALHLVQCDPCAGLATFDKKFARRARGLDGVEVRLI